MAAHDSGNGYYALRCILELRARVKVLERFGASVAVAAAPIQAALAPVVELHEALEAAQQPEPIDEEENDRRFHACMDLIHNATPEQIRAAAGLPEHSSLVERVADAIYRNGTGDGFREEARAAIREVAEWFRTIAPRGSEAWRMAAEVLEQEANQ